MLFTESHCPNEELVMVGTAKVEIFVLGRKGRSLFKLPVPKLGWNSHAAALLPAYFPLP